MAQPMSWPAMVAPPPRITRHVATFKAHPPQRIGAVAEQAQWGAT